MSFAYPFRVLRVIDHSQEIILVMTDQNNYDMSPEVWDEILVELAKKDIKIILECRRLSSFFDQLIRNNRSLRYFVKYPKVLTNPEDTEFSNRLNYFYRACVRGELGVAKILKESFEITADKIKSDIGLEFRLIRDLCERDNLVSSNISSFDRLNVLKWLIREFNLSIKDKTLFEYNGNAYLRAACIGGELEIAKWLSDNFNLTKTDLRDKNMVYNINRCGGDIFQLVCIYGCLDVIKWMVEKFKLTQEDIRKDNNWAFQLACGGFQDESNEAKLNRLQTVKWLVENFNLTQEDIRDYNNYAFYMACESGQTEIVKWLVDEFKLTGKDVSNRRKFITKMLSIGMHNCNVDLEIRESYAEILNFLRSKFLIYHEDFFL